MFRAARDRASLVQAIDPTADDLEGYLFPETYNLPRDAGAEMLVEQMARRFLTIYDAKLREAARARGLTTRQVVTIASLIEKETSRAEERPLVSAVYQNRMRIGMGMQCDPTVIFALQRAGRWTGNLTPREPAVRLALQHLSLRRPAARPDRGAGAGIARGGRGAGRRALPVFRQPQRRVTRLRVVARRAQPQRAPAPGPVFPGSAAAPLAENETCSDVGSPSEASEQ